MRNVRLTLAAEGQLKSIWRYTYETWGEQKADAYLTEIQEKLNLLAETPNLGSTLKESTTRKQSILHTP